MSIGFVCGAECGLTNVGHWGTGNGSPTVDTGTLRGSWSARSYKFTKNGTVWQSVSAPTGRIGSTTVVVSQFWVYITEWPSADVTLWEVDVSAGNSPKIVLNNSGGTLVGKYGTANTGNSAGLSLNTWYRIDVRANISANPRTLDLSIGGSTVGSQASSAETASTWGTSLAFGMFNPGSSLTAGILYVDDIVVGGATGDYPFGPKHVRGSTVTADGTHSTGTGAFRFNTGTAITDATTTAYTALDEYGIGSGSDYVEQQTTAATAYVALGYPTWSETQAPDAVEYVYGYAAASTASANLKIYLRTGTNEDAAFNGSPGSTSVVYGRKVYLTQPGTATAWTQSAADALLSRIGYSSDATPDVRVHGLGVELAYADAAGSVTATPGTASLATTRYAPKLGFGIVTGTASLTLTTYAPTARIGKTITPGTATLTTTAYAPTVRAPRVVIPATRSLALATYAPQLRTTITVPARALTLTAYAPTVTIGASANVTVTPATASLTLTRYAPTVLTPRVVIPATRSLTTTRYAPTVRTPRTVVPGPLGLTLTGFAPLVTASGQPDVGGPPPAFSDGLVAIPGGHAHVPAPAGATFYGAPSGKATAR